MRARARETEREREREKVGGVGKSEREEGRERESGELRGGRSVSTQVNTYPSRFNSEPGKWQHF